jgi:hypothetical protein
MTRHLKDGIIPSLCKYCEETEIPSLYALWTGICTVSGALGRSCSLGFGYKTVFPNLYVVLVARSAGCRKSSSVEQSEFLLRDVEPKVNLLSQKMTPEALIEALSSQSKLDGDRIVPNAEGMAVVDELTTLVDRNSAKNGLINLLTKLYDCGDFEYRTRGRGVEKVRSPCFTLYGGTTLPWIREALSASAISGGFTSRIVFVYLDKREKDIAWPEISQENRRRWECITKDLCEVARLRGPFGITQDAKDLFEYEYKSFAHTSPLANDPLTFGYANRRHFTLLKVAMCISASRTNEKEIDKGDVQVAINALEAAEVDLPKIMRSITSTEVGDICQFVVDIIKRKKIITRAELLMSVRNKITAGQLDDIMTGITGTGSVKTDVRNGKVIYMLVE